MGLPMASMPLTTQTCPPPRRPITAMAPISFRDHFVTKKD
jgi:hypothetical protein